MTLDIQNSNGVLLIHLVGRLDSSSSPELERALVEHLDAGATRLLFDFSNLDYISSAGLRVVLLAGKRIRAATGKMVLVGMRDVVQEVFEMSGFLTIFAVAASIDDGMEKL